MESLPSPSDQHSTRAREWAKLTALPAPEVVIIGGGVNGVGTLRDLALNGVSAVLLESGDFCGGASSASSRMAHGGLRYLEGREFRLVAEAARERNLLLQDAPHLVKPLETVVPLDALVSGLPGAVLRFLGLSKRPGPLSLAALKGGLVLYEWFGSRRRVLPRHRMVLQRPDFPPGLPARVRAVVSYFDGQILGPEALVMEMLGEACANPQVAAINHVAWDQASPGLLTVTDPITGAQATLRPQIIVNAAGSAIDRVNARLGLATRLVRGIKGAHLVLRHPALLQRMAGRAFYFDDGSGRMVICLPVGNSILMGTTEVETADPADRKVAGPEVAYLLRALSQLFADIVVGPEHLVAVTSGIRPLQAGEGNATQAARDHLLAEHRIAGLPVLSLVGGKWTTFRSFSEQATDRVLALLGQQRQHSTADRPYPGAARVDMAALASRHGLVPARASGLLARYGAIAEQVAAFCAAGPDAPLTTLPGYSRREILWLADRRMALTLEDLVLRRTGLVPDGALTSAAVQELAEVLAQALGKDTAWAAAQAEQALADPRILGLAAAGGQNG